MTRPGADEIFHRRLVGGPGAQKCDVEFSRRAGDQRSPWHSPARQSIASEPLERRRSRGLHWSST